MLTELFAHYRENTQPVRTGFERCYLQHTSKQLSEPTVPGTAEDFLQWLLTMAEITAGMSEQPPDDPSPFFGPAFAEHAQLPVSEASTRRRAREILRRSNPQETVLALGDDDCVSCELLRLGFFDVHVVDIDPRVLRGIEQTARELKEAETVVRDAPHDANESNLSFATRLTTHRLDLTNQPLPKTLVHRCAAVVTDPPRNPGSALEFLACARAAVRSEGTIYYCDHPAWNPGLEAVFAQLPVLGLRRVGIRENLHAYPLEASEFSELSSHCLTLGLPEPWLRSVILHTLAWSNLYILEPEAKLHFRPELG